MNIFRLKFLFCALLPLSLWTQDATWIGNSSGNLETPGNWSTGSIPTGVATFDSTVTSVNLYPQILTSGPNSLSFSNFTFPNAAHFIFTINGPYALDFFGTGCGIEGVNTNTIITATNAATGMAVSQLTFSGAGVSIGDAKLYAVVQSGAGLLNSSNTKDLAQILFDGSGDSSSQSCTMTIDSNIAAMNVNNYGSITTTTTAVNNVGQVVFDGSGGRGNGGAPRTGSSEITILGNTILAVDTYNQTFGNGYQANNSNQILFDGSGGFSGTYAGTGQSSVTIGDQAQVLATLTSGLIQSVGIGNDIAQIAFNGSGGTSFGAGGKGSSTVVLKDNAVISATTPDYGYIGYYSTGSLNDTAQILFSGSGGLSHGAAGKGSSTVTITDSATLYASNSYYLTVEDAITVANDVAQILFDGSGGAGYHSGGRGSSTVTINGKAQITADNLYNSEAYGYIYTSSEYVNDLAQILFDGSPGLNYAGMGSGFCSVSISQNAEISAINSQTIINDEYTNDIGQIVFDGGAGFGNGVSTGSGVKVAIQDNVILSASNASTATIQGGYGNNSGQIIFDGGGGFAYDHGGAGSAQVTLQGAAQVSATNAGLLSGNSQYINDLAQILFDGSGGSSNDSGSSGTCTVSISDTVSLQANNSGTLGNTSNLYSNNIAQILMDGGGGLNAFAGGIGRLTATISTSSPLTAVNQSGGVIKNISGSVSNKIGQIIFDGSKGSPTSNVSSGDLVVTLSNSASISASNSGTISTAGSAQGVGQILFDGTPGSGSGSCVLQLDGPGPIIALNTASGIVGGDQIGFYNTVVQGNGVVQAINQGGSITHGVAFYGPRSTAANLNVQLSGSSLWVDATVSPSFSIGPISGDATSTAVFNHSPTLNTSSGTVGLFAGDISGSAGLTITGNGQQILAGTNSYNGATNVVSGNLRLRNSNIPGTLFVANGGAFSGVGTVTGAATIEGTIHPGNSPGTLKFLRGLTLAPTATIQIEVDTTQASLLAVSGGNASLAGTLDILEDSRVRAGKMFPLVTVSGGEVVGTFNTITNTGPLIPVIVYLKDEATLTLQNPPSSFAALLIASDRILRNIETLKHLDVRRQHAFEVFEIDPKMLSNNSEVVLLGDDLAWFQAQKPGKKTEQKCQKQTPWSVYVEPTGSFGHVKSRRDVFGNTFQTVGARAGLDYFCTDEYMPNTSWYYGLGFDAEYNHWWGQQYQHAGTFMSNVAYGSLYGTFVPKAVPELSVNVIGGGGYSWYAFQRHPLGSSSLKAEGNPGGAQADAMFDVEYVFQHDRFSNLPQHFRFTSLAGLQYTYAHINGYRERGAGIYDLKVDSQKTKTLSSLLGFRTGYLFLADSSITVYPELMVQWQYQYLNASIDSQSSTFATASSGEFPYTVPGFSRNSLIAGADLRVDIDKRVMVQLNYDLWYNQNGLINFFLLEFKKDF